MPWNGRGTLPKFYKLAYAGWLNAFGNLLEIYWKFAKSHGNFLSEFVCLLLL